MKLRNAVSVIISQIVLVLFGLSFSVSAVPPDIAGGVADEYKYRELVFLSGEPLMFVGTIKISEKDKGDIKTVTYNFDLLPEDSSIKGKMSRKVTYETTYDRQVDVGQTLSQTEVTNYKETVTIGGDKYDLEDMQFSKSDVVDNRPASDFYDGSFQARKLFTINKDEGEVIVDISGGNVGYKNFWGSTETQLLDYNYTAQRTIENEDEDEDDEDLDTINWQGSVRISVSDSARKSLQYSSSQATLASFTGAYTRVTNQDMSSRYEYDMPLVSDGIPDDYSRNQDSVSLSMEKLPKVERLIIPKFRDVGGHWAENDIKQLYSLDVFEGSKQFFAPDVPMSRVDFVRALVKACDIRTSEATSSKTRSPIRKKTPTEVSPFRDLPATDPDYQYIKTAIEKSLVSGIDDDLFGPDEDLTRAQAITMVISALGYEDRAPTPGYITSFSDDDDIPDWSRDSIYVAREIGLISGDTSNMAKPEKVMTRAEASSMLVRFLNFMQIDLQKDYRDNIILFS